MSDSILASETSMSRTDSMSDCSSGFPLSSPEPEMKSCTVLRFITVLLWSAALLTERCVVGRAVPLLERALRLALLHAGEPGEVWCLGLATPLGCEVDAVVADCADRMREACSGARDQFFSAPVVR